MFAEFIQFSPENLRNSLNLFLQFGRFRKLLLYLFLRLDCSKKKNAEFLLAIDYHIVENQEENSNLILIDYMLVLYYTSFIRAVVGFKG